VGTRTLLTVGLAALAFSLLNVGLALEKKGASQLPSIEGAGAARSLKNFLTNPTWLIGFVMTIVQLVFLSLALGLGPMTLVMPMAGVGLVVLAAFSRFYLGEVISRPMLAGIALVVAGIVILGATHPGATETLSADAALVDRKSVV
jgi:multidrug transporter EmrE-like cation transporter